MRLLCLLSVLIMLNCGPVPAQGVDSLDIIKVPGGVTRFISNGRSAPPEDFDLLLSASDRLLNKLIRLALEKQNADSPSGKRLKSMEIHFSEGTLCLSGTFYMPARAGANTKADFDFSVCTRLSAIDGSDIEFDIESCRVKLNGVVTFDSDRTGIDGVGAVLDFLEPGIVKNSAENLDRMARKVEKAFGADAVPDAINVDDILVIDGGTIVVKILPRLLSPLFPNVELQHIGVADGMLQIFVLFPEDV